MKSIINGKTYNTVTAQEVCELPCSSNQGDFKYHATTLYQTDKGTFFLSGRGGPLSMWAQSEGNGFTGGEGLTVIGENEARNHMESADCDADIFEACGLTLEEG